MKQSFLIGKNIYLRGLMEKDLASEGSYFQWFNDQEVCDQNSHGRFPNSESSMRAYFEGPVRSRNSLVLAIVAKDQDVHIGNVSLQNINWIDRCAEFAIIVGEKSYWGKGLAKEAAALIVQHGFRVLNLHRIYCGTTEANTAMQSLAQSLGMIEEGRRRDAVYKNGRYWSVLEYGVLREEFKEE